MFTAPVPNFSAANGAIALGEKIPYELRV